MPPDLESNTVPTESAAPNEKELWRDPPPRPETKLDGPEEAAQIGKEVENWLQRNGNADQLRSWDPRVMYQLPVLSRVWGYDEEWYRMKLFGENLHLTRLTGRRLSTEELSLITFYISKGVAAASYDRPIAFGVTAFLLWRGAATYRMPFYQPQFVRFAHPRMTSRPHLSGLAWHGTRIGAYGALGYAAYRMFSGQYQRYMIDSFGDDGLQYDLGLKKMTDDIDANVARLERDVQRRRGLGGQIP